MLLKFLVNYKDFNQEVLSTDKEMIIRSCCPPPNNEIKCHKVYIKIFTSTLNIYCFSFHYLKNVGFPKTTFCIDNMLCNT